MQNVEIVFKILCVLSFIWLTHLSFRYCDLDDLIFFFNTSKLK